MPRPSACDGDTPAAAVKQAELPNPAVPQVNLISFEPMADRHQFPDCITRLFAIFALYLLSGVLLGAQQAATAPSAAASGKNNPEFLATADEVLKDMSEITGWKLKTPLKKTIRSREEIHAYVIHQMDDEKDAKERYASMRSAEAFGLIPKGFDLENFLVELLTEQIAGLYDPKAHEFYIADWIAPEDQRMVMSHELTHALEDQHFQIEPWVKAARPNDDAEMARESVLEGSAMAAMLDYMLRDKGLKLRDLPDIDPGLFMGDLSQTPMLKKAPPFIKDSLMFPYFSGLTFSMTVLKTGGWDGFASVFAKPPANTQQIMHPEFYRAGKAAPVMKLELPEDFPGKSWELLEENYMGEFGWKEILKQFLDEERAKTLAASWDGDIYATYEWKEEKRVLLVTRIRLSNPEAAVRFFGQYSEALEKKHTTRSNLYRRPSFFTFDTPGGGVFLRCVGNECVTLEGGDRAQYLQWTKRIGWEALPEDEKKSGDNQIKTSK
jgi:hypothetical protein